MGVGASEFQRAVHRLGAAIGEKDAIEPRPFDELARQRGLEGVLKQIRKMDGASRLAPNYPNQIGLGMAESVYRDATEKIQILAALRIVDTAAAAACKDDRRATVGIEKI